MDREISPTGQGRLQWRSRDVERRRSLELTGVTDAIEHPTHGRTASLRKTIALCVAAALAVAAMVLVGIETTGSRTPESKSAAIVLDEPAPEVVVAEPANNPGGDPASRLDLAALADGAATADVPAAEPNRANCGAIRGTSYASETEHVWYLDNCVVEEPVASYADQPNVAGESTQPTLSTDEVVSGVTAGDAIASSIDWITTQSDVLYDVSADGCSATDVGAVWLVSCERSLRDCDLAECRSWVSLCVTDATGELVATADC